MTIPARDYEKAAHIVQDAGNQIVGRTRLQKIGYLLELAGLGAGFEYDYRHYGPYSEKLANAVDVACLLDVLEEEERTTNWGGFYSIYKNKMSVSYQSSPERIELVGIGVAADAIELELAATAAFLAVRGLQEPWAETGRLKPEKAKEGRLDKARFLYKKIQEVKAPKPLPNI